MTAAGWVLVLWGVYNAILATLLFIFKRADGLSFAMAYTAAGACLGLGLLLVWIGRRRRRTRGEAAEFDTDARLLPDLSYSTMLLGLSLFGLVFSAAFGLWLTLISAGAALLAIGGLVRERRAMDAARAGLPEPRGGSRREERA
jgi:O-antigen/teichoic acid export membrane protein